MSNSFSLSSPSLIVRFYFFIMVTSSTRLDQVCFVPRFLHHEFPPYDQFHHRLNRFLRVRFLAIFLTLIEPSSRQMVPFAATITTNLRCTSYSSIFTSLPIWTPTTTMKLFKNTSKHVLSQFPKRKIPPPTTSHPISSKP
jgi:hypothetical protein